MALLSGSTLENAAGAAKVNRGTLRRWLRDDAFREGLQQGQNEALSVVTARLVALLGKSLDVLAADLAGSDARAASRAALGILGRFVDLLQYLSLAQRIEALEAWQNENTSQQS